MAHLECMCTMQPLRNTSKHARSLALLQIVPWWLIHDLHGNNMNSLTLAKNSCNLQVFLLLPWIHCETWHYQCIQFKLRNNTSFPCLPSSPFVSLLNRPGFVVMHTFLCASPQDSRIEIILPLDVHTRSERCRYFDDTCNWPSLLGIYAYTYLLIVLWHFSHQYSSYRFTHISWSVHILHLVAWS